MFDKFFSSKCNIPTYKIARYCKIVQRAEELLLKHEDDKLVLTIVLVENLHIQWVLTSTVVDTNSNEMMEMNWLG
jgi:hypothetical protein